MSRARRASPLPAALMSAAMMSRAHTPACVGRDELCSFWRHADRLYIFENCPFPASVDWYLVDYLLAIGHVAANVIVS